MAQQSLLTPKPQTAAKHAPASTRQGKCGTQVLMRSKKNPTRRVWQCTDTQRELFRDEHATKLMGELERGRPVNLTRRRREHPSIQKLVDEKLIEVTEHPKHSFYEHQAKLTRDGKEWLKLRAQNQKKRDDSQQEALFKSACGRIVRLVLRKCGCLAPNYRPAGDDGTSCGSCKWRSGAFCDRFDFALTLDHTCDDWEGHAVSDVGRTTHRSGRPISKLVADAAGKIRAAAGMAKGAAYPNPIPLEADDVIGVTPTSTWDDLGYECRYRHNGRIGVVTISNPSMRVPYSIIATGPHQARQYAHEAVQMLRAGQTPERGVYSSDVSRKRRKRGGQGGSAL